MGGYIYIIAVIIDDSGLIGYRLLDSNSGAVQSFPKEVVEQMAQQGMIANAVYMNSGKGIVARVGGTPISSLPVTTRDGYVQGRRGIAVLGYLEKDGQKVGVLVCDCFGQKKGVSWANLSNMVRRYTCCNFKMSGIHAVPLFGEQWNSLDMDTVSGSGGGYRGAEGGKADLTQVQYTVSEDIDTSSFDNTAVQGRLFDAVINLKKVSPYYWVMWGAIDVKMSLNVPTFGVTEDKLFYNPEFLLSQSVEELTFIIMHEIDHLGMRHSVRQGSRDHELWNIACDLYINSSIVDEFDLTVGVTKTVNGGHLCAPLHALYPVRNGFTLDLSRETPETIYNNLKKIDDGGGGDGEPNDSGNGGSGGNNVESGEPSNSGSNASGDGSSSDYDASQSQSGENQSQGGGSQSQGDGNQSQGDGNQSQRDNQSQKFNSGKSTVTYNGKPLVGNILDDIGTNNDKSTEEGSKAAEEQSRNQITRMNTKKEMVEEQTGQELTVGDGLGVLQREIEFGISSRVDWRVVLKNMAQYVPNKKYSLNRPNRSYMQSGITVASRSPVAKHMEVKNIKICVDASGSISDDLLKWMLSEIANIFTRFNVCGELCYWSTQVGDSCEFKKVQDIQKAQPLTTGGTDVRCLFEYLAGQESTMTGKDEKNSIKDMAGVVVITDGCFSSNYGDYERAFGRKTMWILTTQNSSFKPCFGRVALVDYEGGL